MFFPTEHKQNKNKTKQIFLKCFCNKTTKYVNDSLNVIVILAPDSELFSTKCDKFPLTFTGWN